MSRAIAQDTQTLPSGPWTLVNDAIDSASSGPAILGTALNVYPDPQLGTWIGRPGTRPFGASGLGTQLGVSGHRRVQCQAQWTRRDALGAVTRFTVDICGGKFYSYDWGTDSYTEIETAADFAAKGITLDRDAQVFFVIAGTQTGFAQLLLHDGINTPFLWDGTPGDGAGAGLTKLTNCPVLYGQPVVNYSKVMGLVAANRGQLVWGEENDPTVGYFMPQYNNVWQDPGSQDANPMFGLIATNDALFVSRERSSTSITGKLDTQFATTSVRQDVSPTVGVASSASLVFHEGTIFSMDADGRPRYQVGLSVNDSLWRECRRTIGTFNLGAQGSVQGADYTPAGCILFGVPETNSTDMTAVVVISVTSGEPHFAGIWSGWGTFCSLAMVEDQDGVPVLCYGSTNGYVFRFGDPNRVGSTQIWNDVAPGGTESPIMHRVSPSHIGANTQTEWQFLRADIVFVVESDMTVGVGYSTPRSTSNQLSATMTGGGTLYGTAKYGTFRYASAGFELHKAFGYGRNANGRWLIPDITHGALDEQFGISNMTVDAIQVSRQPRTP